MTQYRFVIEGTTDRFGKKMSEIIKELEGRFYDARLKSINIQVTKKQITPEGLRYLELLKRKEKELEQ